MHRFDENLKQLAHFDGEPSELMDDWPEYKQKIIELARKESVSWPFIKKLLLGLEDESFTYPEGLYITACVQS